MVQENKKTRLLFGIVCNHIVMQTMVKKNSLVIQYWCWTPKTYARTPTYTNSASCRSRCCQTIIVLAWSHCWLKGSCNFVLMRKYLTIFFWAKGIVDPAKFLAKDKFALAKFNFSHTIYKQCIELQKLSERTFKQT